MIRAVIGRIPLGAVGALLCFANPALASEPPPIAGAFVYPVGDEQDYTKPARGEPAGFAVSDKYLAVREGRKGQRLHYGVDLSNRRAGSEVRAVASGVVVVSDGNALVKYRKKQRLRVPVVQKGKRVYKWSTRYRTAYRWRTGWGNRVVIRHVLPDGEVVHSLYAHLKPHSVCVKVGDVVAAGQVIARVGRTGRASAPHLHLEIRKGLPDPGTLEPVDADEETEAEAADSASEYGGPSETDGPIAMRANGTMDPIAFLERHVKQFDDLAPGSWESRYAVAACRDGVLGGQGNKFQPDQEIRLGDFYGALVRAFLLETPFTKPGFDSFVGALVNDGILDRTAARGKRPGDEVTQSEALELVLRCLDRTAARGRSLAQLEATLVCRDFNRQFAGPDAALKAEQAARDSARTLTKAREQAARDRYEQDLRWVRKTGKKTHVRLARVKPAAPVYTVDAGFEKLAASDRRITRAETALLLASALRAGPQQLSALERAARDAEPAAASR